MSPTVHQTEHVLLRETLRMVLAADVKSLHDSSECRRVVCGSVAALDSLLAAHRIDRRGRCWSCGRPGWLGRRRRVCLVYVQARYWLRQPIGRVLAHLGAELGLDPSPASVDPASGAVRCRAESDLSDPCTEPVQTPAVPRTPTAVLGRPDFDHGEVGVSLEHSDLAVAPPGGRSLGPGGSLPPAGVATWTDLIGTDVRLPVHHNSRVAR